MGSKKISSLIIACLICNTLSLAVPREFPRTGGPLPAFKTSVFQLVALVRLPFTVTADMFSEDVPAAPGYNPVRGTAERDTPAGARDGKAGDDGYAFSNQGKDVRSVARTGHAGGPGMSAGLLPHGAGTLPSPIAASWPGFKYIVLLLCLLALLKGTLPWEMRYRYV